MGRNHFSKHGGPYFINDGFSRHLDNKPVAPLDKGFFYLIALFFTIPLASLLLLYIL
jgi:hypothetical protein